VRHLPDHPLRFLCLDCLDAARVDVGDSAGDFVTPRGLDLVGRLLRAVVDRLVDQVLLQNVQNQFLFGTATEERNR